MWSNTLVGTNMGLILHFLEKLLRRRVVASKKNVTIQVVSQRLWFLKIEHGNGCTRDMEMVWE